MVSTTSMTSRDVWLRCVGFVFVCVFFGRIIGPVANDVFGPLGVFVVVFVVSGRGQAVVVRFVIIDLIDATSCFMVSSSYILTAGGSVIS